MLDTAILDHAGNAGLLVDVARAVELYVEAAVGIQEEELDRISEEAWGSAVLGEEIVDGGAVGGGGGGFPDGNGKKKRRREERRKRCEEEDEEKIAMAIWRKLFSKGVLRFVIGKKKKMARRLLF